jgi:hypothetical protein
MAQSTFFLALPAELRNQIYSYITPINGRPELYVGLFLFCKQIDAKMDEKRAKYMHYYIDALEAKWAAFRSSANLHKSLKSKPRKLLDCIPSPRCSISRSPFRKAFTKINRLGTPTVGASCRIYVRCSSCT